MTDAASQASQLAQLEVRRDLREATAGAAGFGLAGAGAAFGTLFVLLAAMFGLATWLPAWASALIVGFVVLVGSGLVALVARRTLRHVRAPERTVRTLKDDARWLRHPTSSRATVS